MSEQENNWRETLNKEWSKDFPTLSTQEIQKILRLAFYQLFLIDIDSIKIISDIDTQGHYVKFEIEGEAYMDGANIDTSIYEEKEDDV